MNQPFFRLPVASNRDLLLARQKARQISHLLHFDPHEEACVVAGTFAVGCQAKQLLGVFELCFQVESKCLVVFARQKKSENLHQSPVAEGEPPLLKLRKSIPEKTILPALDDLGWMLAQVDQNTPTRLFEEVAMQNQEILMLLHELQLAQGKGEKSSIERNNPTAA